MFLNNIIGLKLKKILEFYLKNFKKKSHLKKLQDLEKFI